MSKVVTVNYTAEQEQTMKARYTAAKTDADRAAVVNELAAEFGKKVQSIRQKLVRMEVYVKKTYATKNGEKPESKEAIVSRICKANGLNMEAFESLTKANKNVLEWLADQLVEESDAEESDAEEETTEE